MRDQKTKLTDPFQKVLFFGLKYTQNKEVAK